MWEAHLVEAASREPSATGEEIFMVWKSRNAWVSGYTESADPQGSGSVCFSGAYWASQCIYGYGHVDRGLQVDEQGGVDLSLSAAKLPRILNNAMDGVVNTNSE